MLTVQLDDYLQHLKLERGMALNTLAAYRRDISDFLAWSGITNAAKVSGSNAQQYLSHLTGLGRKPTTLARRITSLKRFFDYLAEQGAISKNPFRSFRAPRLSRYHPHYLSPDEIKRILEAVDPNAREGTRDRAILELLYGSGLRISELLSLSWGDFEFEAGFVRVTGKGDKQRLAPLGQYAIEALKALQNSPLPPGLQISDIVFRGRSGARLTRVAVWKMIKKVVLKAGITKEVSPHTFRHSFATHMIEGGADLRVVQEMLGHADISTTQIYTTIDRDYIIAEHRKYHPRELARPQDERDA
ncbi:MAG TPA: site-specific tyrosine recombinase [candidate division Zixibacteria bacterium]|nr:site-specific tyrosine recombinase [candidate division Zixibacteria bacterium]